MAAHSAPTPATARRYPGTAKKRGELPPSWGGGSSRSEMPRNLAGSETDSRPAYVLGVEGCMPGTCQNATRHANLVVVDQPGENLHGEDPYQVDHTQAGGPGPAVQSAPDRPFSLGG